MASPPNAFTNELAQWVGNRCRESVVFVELRPRDADMVKQQWDYVSPISKDDEKGTLNSERLRMCKKYQCCTGSVVKRRHGESLWILTCAHVLGPAFKATKQISAAQVNQLYEAMILCDHQEQIYQREVLQNPDQERVYMRAEVCRISCLKDLMLLRIQAGEVQNCCPHPHRQLRMARAFPGTFESVVMLSWPIEADRTAVEGKVTHPSRPFKSLSKTNPHGYRMRLSQINITSENGSSGALLLDGSANYVGVLYGGNGKFSFYISYADLQEKALQWGKHKFNYLILV